MIIAKKVFLLKKHTDPYQLTILFKRPHYIEIIFLNKLCNFNGLEEAAKIFS